MIKENQPHLKTIGEKIKYLRLRIPLTQTELAERAGLHPISIARYELGKRIPDREQLSSLAQALNVSLFAFFDIVDENFKIDTIADFFGLLFMLHRSGLVVFDGERDKEGVIQSDTLSIKLNESSPISRIFRFCYLQKPVDNNKIVVELLDEKAKENLCKWERLMQTKKELEPFISSQKEKVMINLENAYRDKIFENCELIELELLRKKMNN